MLVLVLPPLRRLRRLLLAVLPPPRCLRRLLLLLLLEPIVFQPQRTKLPVAALPADAQHRHSKPLAVAATPVAADIAADPVHTAPPASMSPCLLHPLMLRIYVTIVTIRGGELLARRTRPRCRHNMSCCCCSGCYCYRC